MTIKLNDKDFLEIAQWCKDDGLTLDDARDFAHFIGEKDRWTVEDLHLSLEFIFWKRNKKETL